MPNGRGTSSARGRGGGRGGMTDRSRIDGRAVNPSSIQSSGQGRPAYQSQPSRDIVAPVASSWGEDTTADSWATEASTAWATTPLDNGFNATEVEQTLQV